MTAPVLVEVWRGDIVESRHRGHIAAVDGTGKVVATVGDAKTRCFFRSSAKPFQALPLLRSGAADHFKFSPAQIALACASHSGQEFHTTAAREMLEKIQLTPSHLHCGSHMPFNKESAEEILKNGIRPNTLHNNCSGKHSGMLALARYLRSPVETYEQLSHPVQQQILDAISAFARVHRNSIPTAIDGCSVPTFGLSIQEMATAFAGLATPEKLQDLRYREPARRVTSAMRDYPQMVAGTGELDTELMKAANGKLICKSGAECVFCAAVFPSSKWPNGLGIALKIEDGQNSRTRGPVAIEILRQLEVLTDEEIEQLGGFKAGAITNHRGIRVGELKLTLSLTAAG